MNSLVESASAESLGAVRKLPLKSECFVEYQYGQENKKSVKTRIDGSS